MDQSSTIATTVIVCAVALCILSAAVAFMGSMTLAEFVQIFSFLQALALIGVSGAKESPYFSQQLSAAAVYLNLINWDIEIIRSGCGGMSVQYTHTHIAHSKQRVILFKLFSEADY